MIRLHRARRREMAQAFAWPKTGNATPQTVRDGFGPRTFAAHVPTVGYDYDFHRGADLPMAAGDPVYAMGAGPIIRLHETHYGWDTASQLAKWTEVDPNACAAFSQVGSALRIVGARVGAQAFAAAGLIVPVRERIDVASTWEMRVTPTGGQTVAGGVVGFGFYDGVEYVAIEYDGTTLTARGRQAAGVLSVDGATATATPTAFRMTYDQTTIAWQYTTASPVTTATVWTTVASKAAVAFTRGGSQLWAPVCYWRSTDTDAAAQTFDVDHVGWYDANSISRFGNWIEIQNNGTRVSQMHMRELACAQGDIVEAGQLVGTAGNEGFDARSGPVLFVHCHVEYALTDGYYYSNADPINPLGVGVLPRANVSDNVAVVRTTATDPDGVTCWLLTVTVTRADEDLDVNAITATGDTASRSVNFNTRAGLSPDNDVPKAAGVYIVCTDFDEASPTLVYQVYVSKAVVGSTWVGGEVRDTSGAVLWAG